MDALSVGLVVIWLIVAVVAASIGRLAGSYDRAVPWPAIGATAVVGAVVGGLCGLAIEDRFAAGTVGAGIGAGALVAAYLILAIQRSNRSHSKGRVS